MQSLTAEELFDAASAFIAAQRWQEALDCLQNAILQKPIYPAAYNQRGNVLQCMGRHFDAVLNYGAALTQDPQSPDLYNNRGAALQVLEDYPAALKDYHTALGFRTKFPQCLTNIGNVLHLSGDPVGSKEYFKKAIAVGPDYVDAHFNLACTELETGNFEAGWEEYEWRWKTGQVTPRGFDASKWDGEDLKDKTILIWGEQGLGDAIQFIRFASELKKLGAREVIAEVRAPLLRISKTVPGIDRVVVHGDDLKEPIDYHIPMMSIPRILKIRADNIPADVPYFCAPEVAIKQWGEKLSQYKGLKVGICWAGSPRPFQPAASAVDRRRSTHLQQWLPLGSVQNVLFVSLQKEAAAEQGSSPPLGMSLANFAHELDDMTDTAALMMNLDLIITVDTAVVHLAGALGRPTWLLSRHDNCWRWLGRRQDSPWYPTLRQFIQPKQADWEAVFNEVSTELKRFVVEKSRLHAVA